MFGEGVTAYLSDYNDKPRVVIPSGSIGLDYALGVGGFVLGKMVEFYGQPGSGKTTLGWSVAASALRTFPDKKVLYIDAEHSADLSLIDVFGIDKSRVVLVSAETAEDNLTIGETFIKTGEFCVVIVDSIAALVPRAEYEGTMADQQMGLHARLMSKMCRNYKPVVAKSETLLILINQMREKITAYGDPSTTTGGKAIPFYADVRVKVATSHTKKNLLRDSNGEAIGQKVTFSVVKNKMAPPFREAETSLFFGKGFDRYAELFELGQQFGIIERLGAYYAVGDFKVMGKANFLQVMEYDEKLLNSIKSPLFKILGILSPESSVVPVEATSDTVEKTNESKKPTKSKKVPAGE